MEKQISNFGNSRGIILPSEIFKEIEKINFEIDTKKRKIEITW